MLRNGGQKICAFLSQLFILTLPATAQKNDGEACPYQVGKKLARLEQNHGKYLAQMEASKTIAVIVQAAGAISAAGGRHEGPNGIVATARAGCCNYRENAELVDHKP